MIELFGGCCLLFDFLKKCECKNERLYKDVVEAIRDSLDINKTKKTIINVIGQALNADRCFIIDYDKKENRFKVIQQEYLSSSDLKSCIGLDINISLPNFVKEFKSGKTLIYNQSIASLDGQKINLNDEEFKAEKFLIEEYKVYSSVVFSIFYSNEFFGDLVLQYVGKEHQVGEDEMNLLQTVSGQLAIAIHQAELFEQMKIQNEVQNAILNNIPFMAWLKDVDGKFMMVNKKMAEAYGASQDEIIGKYDSDFTPEQAKNYRETDLEAMDTKETKVVEESIINKDELRWSETFKSPIIDSHGNVLGTAGLAHDITDRKAAELEILQKQEQILQHAQRERISRSIIEILRSSLDKSMIKKQFVRNIGKFFNADRVFICEYDSEKKIYLTADIDSEYLSNHDVKSFVGYDWSHPEIFEYVKPLLEKREIKIPDWNLYMQENPNISSGYKKLYEDYGIKSNYKFPILNQSDMIGYLCVQFTQKCHELDEEDITRIRSICTQAGIALYQANLYKEAQEAIKLKNEFISDTVSVAKTILNNIVELSEAMAGKETQCEKHIEYLDHVKENIILLLKLTNDVTKNGNIT